MVFLSQHAPRVVGHLKHCQERSVKIVARCEDVSRKLRGKQGFGPHSITFSNTSNERDFSQRD